MDTPQLLLENQLCFPVYSISRLITKLYKPHLDALGITYPQYLVLLLLWEQDEQTVNAIAKKLLLNTNTISPLLKRLEKQGIVQRKRSTEDERSVAVLLTTKGKQLKEQAKPIPEKLLTEMAAAGLSAAELAGLQKTLCSWMSALAKTCAAADADEKN